MKNRYKIISKELIQSAKDSLFLRTFRLLLQSKKHFLLFQIVYAIITLFCIVPLSSFMIGLAGKYSGYSYITTENLADFLMRPLTILVAVVLFVIIGLFLLGEISLISAFTLAGKGLDKRPPIYIFLGSLRNTLFCFQKKNIGSILLSYFVLIATNIIVIIGVVTRTRIPNYIVKSITHIPMMKMTIGA